MYTVKFGKHKGSDISDVPTEYLQWAAANMEGSFAGVCAKELESRGDTPPEKKPVSVEGGIVEIDRALKRILAKLSGIEKALNISNPYEQKPDPAPEPAVSGEFGSIDDDALPF